MKANPDAPQLPVRTRALEDRKRLYMAVPRLRSESPFLLLDPGRIGVAARRAASIRGASTHATPVALHGVERIDVVVCGSVAVDRRGARLGKGGGYADLELALLRERGLVDDDTTIVTTVHPLQIIDRVPETRHDFRVDVIVTPDRTVRCRGRRRRPGIVWDDLEPAKIAAVPVLRAVERQFSS